MWNVITQMHAGRTSWHHQGLFMGLHWAWWLFWIAVFAVLLWAVVRVVVERRLTRRAATAKESAEEALRTRFARGEIDVEELEERLRILRQS